MTAAAVEKHMELCISRAADLEKKISVLPEGNLYCCHTGKYEYFIAVLPDKTRKYIRKENREYAQKLALRKLYTVRLHDLMYEIEACRSFLRCVLKASQEEKFLTDKASDGFLELLSGGITENGAEKWEKEPYRKSNKYPGSLIVPTIKGDKVRSKAEAIIANALFSLGIPYRYEQRCMIGKIETYPDFIVLDVRTGTEIIIEFFGMMDNPRYISDYNMKMGNYIRNGYVPDINLLCFYETSGNPLDSRYVYQKLEYFFK